jgi:proline dehydrogenase
MHTERERAEEMKYQDPVAPNINATHANYYKGLEIAFANLSNVGIMIASHNEDTVTKTIDRLKELNVDPKCSRVQFAQLFGMGDHLSFLVVQNGFRAFKYVPFGPIEHVIPYLVRRMQENRGFIGSASDKERKLLWRELMRRLSFRQSTSSNTTSGVVTQSRGTL